MRADSDAQLHAAGLKWLRPHWLAVICLASILVVGGRSMAGEKINITESQEKIDLPKEPKEFGAPRPGFLPSRVTGGESSQGPVLPHPGQPTLLRNPKLEEAFDRKKNWMFDSPNNLDRDRDLEETFGVRRYEMNGLEKKSSKAVDRYFEMNDKNTKGTRSLKDGSGREGLSGRKELDPAGHLSTRDEHEEESLGIIPELNPAQLFNLNMPSDPLSRFGSVLGGTSILPPGLADPAAPKTLNQPARESSQPQREADKPWEIRSSPLGRLSDPINSQTDSTRSIMNPIAARKASVPPPESSQGRIGEGAFGFGNNLPSANLPLGSRSEPFGFGRDKVSAGPSFTPTMRASASSPLPQAKPMVLEIPRPRF